MLMDEVNWAFSPRRKFHSIWYQQQNRNHELYFRKFKFVPSTHTLGTYQACPPSALYQNQCNSHWLKSREGKIAQEPDEKDISRHLLIKQS